MRYLLNNIELLHANDSRCEVFGGSHALEATCPRSPCGSHALEAPVGHKDSYLNVAVTLGCRIENVLESFNPIKFMT